MDGTTMIQVEFVAIDYICCCCKCSDKAISEVEKEWGSSGQHRCGFQYPICQKMELVYPYHSSTMAIVHTGSNQQCSALSGGKKLKYIHEQSEKQNMERLQPSDIYSHLPSPGPSVWYSGIYVGYCIQQKQQQIPWGSRTITADFFQKLQELLGRQADWLETIRSLQKNTLESTDCPWCLVSITTCKVSSQHIKELGKLRPSFRLIFPSVYGTLASWLLLRMMRHAWCAIWCNLSWQDNVGQT